MSAINKKPFLVSLIESLSEEQISTLRAMINGEGNQTVLMRTMHVKPLGERTHLTAADKGIHRCNLEVDFSLLNGYLIYTDDYCVLICYTDFQTLSWYNLDLEKMNANTISEELTVLELRSELDDSSAAEKAEIIGVVEEMAENDQIKVKTYQAFPSSWPTTGTTKAFCDAINADANAKVGMGYAGEISFSDLPFNGNGDLVVEIFNGPNDKKTIHLILNSGNTEPYHWEYTYWNDGVNVSNWLTLGTKVEANPTLAGTEANLAGLQVGNTKYKVVTPSDVETAVNNAVYGAIDASY